MDHAGKEPMKVKGPAEVKGLKEVNFKHSGGQKLSPIFQLSK